MPHTPFSGKFFFAAKEHFHDTGNSNRLFCCLVLGVIFSSFYWTANFSLISGVFSFLFLSFLCFHLDLEESEETVAFIGFLFFVLLPVISQKHPSVFFGIFNLVVLFLMASSRKCVGDGELSK